MTTTTTLDRKSKLEWKKKYTIALREHVRKGNWEKLEELLPAAESFGVSEVLLQKTWFGLGQRLKKDDKLISALESFVAARKHALDDELIYSEIIECLTGFINRFEAIFSREDLVHLEYGLDRIFRFHKTRKSHSSENLNRSNDLLARIRTIKEVAPSKRETPATPNVFRIFAALYSGMTQDEVKVEFARLVAPLIRKKLSEKAAEAKKPSSAGAGKKPPKNKDADDDSDENVVKNKNKKDDGKNKPTKK